MLCSQTRESLSHAKQTLSRLGFTKSSPPNNAILSRCCMIVNQFLECGILFWNSHVKETQGPAHALAKSQHVT